LLDQFDTTHGEKYWFHATNVNNAQEIIQFGPTFDNNPSDYAANGVFYLNPSYIDCYDWLVTRNSRFDGYHAMLIFKFDPEKLSSKGKNLLCKNG